MAKKDIEKQSTEYGDATISISAALSKKAVFKRFELWVIGDTPLITHAWSEKAKREMLSKQVKAVRAAKEARDPSEDFINSLYEMGDGTYGFPATGVKNAIISAAHKDKGIARTDAMRALWIDAQMVRTRPALAHAVCDMPLLRIYGTEKPAMREDMVRVGVGLNKTASLAYRGQFTIWAFRITGRLNIDLLSPEQLAFLIDDAGMANGLGEWRNEKKGMFGAFHLGTPDEEAEWSAFIAGEGPLPLPASYQQAAE